MKLPGELEIAKKQKQNNAVFGRCLLRVYGRCFGGCILLNWDCIYQGNHGLSNAACLCLMSFNHQYLTEKCGLLN